MEYSLNLCLFVLRLGRAHPVRTVLTAGLIAGFLDGMDAVVFRSDG